MKIYIRPSGAGILYHDHKNPEDAIKSHVAYEFDVPDVINHKIVI